MQEEQLATLYLCLFLDSFFKSQQWFSEAALPTATFKHIDQTLKLPSILNISAQVKGEVC